MNVWTNGLRIRLDTREIMFVPDQYLGHYVSTKTDKEMILWSGYCRTHMRILPQDIMKLRQECPQAKVVVHPECRLGVIALADEVLSTGGMFRFAQGTEAKEIYVGTENGIIHRLRKENPGKKFIPASSRVVCLNMKLITLEKILWSLEGMAPEVKVPQEIRIRAKAAVDKMLEIGSAGKRSGQEVRHEGNLSTFSQGDRSRRGCYST